MSYLIPNLPLKDFVETPKILKKAISANKILAELKGLAQTIPNQSILINTLALQESKDSSEIENIVTTHDDLFRADTTSDGLLPAIKEVYRYNEALYFAFNYLKNQPITSNLLTKVFRILTGRRSSFRNVPGTVLKNIKGETVYSPPQDYSKIKALMANLEKYINDDELCDCDVLVKMAIIHHQFESIHPFFDGNGRTGRILNILYLIDKDILDIPVLYLSRYITENKKQYYELLQAVRDGSAWEEWVLYMLTAIEETGRQTIMTIKELKMLMSEYKKTIKEEAGKIYSHELINTIFAHPYTKIEFVVESVGVTRITAAKYLNILVKLGLLRLEKHKNTNYFINERLVKLFYTLR